MNQLMSQIQELHNKANSLTDKRDFHDPEGSSSSGASYVPSRSMTILSRNEKPSRDPAMPNDTWNAMGTSGNVLKAYLLEKDNPYLASRIPGIWHYLLAKWKKDSRMRRDAQSSTIPNPSQERGPRTFIPHWRNLFS